MPPGLGLIIFGGLGYVLIYASVANRGRFATHPWAGVLADAYTDGATTPAGLQDTGPPAQSSVDATPRPVRPRGLAV